jgi:ABC-type phosphate transport system substrate-binding protein
MRTLLLIVGVVWTSLSQAGGLLIITSTQVSESAISVEQLADIYTLKKTFWADGMQVVPVNREASSAEREKFSEAVFNISSQELAEYLNRLRFQGKLPPLIQTSNQAVLGFVRSVPGAIGYINASQIPPGIKVLIRLP